MAKALRADCQYLLSLIQTKEKQGLPFHSRHDMITPIVEELFARATDGDLHSPSEAGAHVLALYDVTAFPVSSMFTQ